MSSSKLEHARIPPNRGQVKPRVLPGAFDALFASRSKGGDGPSKPDDLRLHKDGGEGVHKDSSLYSHIKMKVQQLNRKKDIVCLILSYPPMNSVNRRRHEVWIHDILKINEMVREMEAPLGKKVIDALELSSQITRLLDHTEDDIEPYVPREIIDKMCKKTLEVDMSVEGVTMRLLSTGIEMTARVARHGEKMPMQEKLFNLVVELATCQILQEIENPKLLRIGISGRDGVRVTSTLMNLTKIRETFDVVIQVNGSLHSTTTAIEENIAAQLGLSTWTEPELNEVLKGTNFLIIIENIHEWVELYRLGTNWWNSKKIQKIVSMTRFHDVHQRMLLDLEICMDDHLLSWELFCLNVGNVVHSLVIQRLAIHVVKECRGHLLAIILLARALKEVSEVHIWEYASHALTLKPASQMKDEVLFNTLAFICGHLGNSKTNCLKYFVDIEYGEKLEEENLIGGWITCDLIGKIDEGEKIVYDFVNAFLLESSWNGDSVFVQMRGEIREALLNLLGLETRSLYLWLGGEGLTEPPKDVAWEKANEVHLMNNKISELPKSPDCPQLRTLFLQINHHLRVIPTMFFRRMPVLQILDLSHTRIRSLPQSLSNLVQLKIFLLRGCRLLMELPPEVGELSNLEVLDLEETEIINLPVNVGRLTNLKSLKVSFYGYNCRNRKNNQSNMMIPQNVISKLLRLEELSIYVNPDDRHWNVIVKDIVKEVCSLKRLEALKLYLPEVIFLNDFMSNGTSSINLSLLNFRFIVGSHSKRFISRLPHEIAVKFEQQEKCLKYVNGEGFPVEIKEVLQYTTALLLDRHATLTTLSEFGIGNIKNLEFCVLGECSEIESLVDGAEIYTQGDEGGDVRAEIILGSLQYLRLHYMKNLRSIWKGPIQRGCLSNLKYLELHACPHLTTIFTLDLLENLNILEELVVERCPEINSIVTREVPVEHRWFPLVMYLPKLKKLSVHYMPKLVSISSGLHIAPTLEWMSFYNCPSLQTLSDMEVSSNNLRVIIGEADWWRALKWSTSAFGRVMPCNLDSIFVPIKQDIDLMTQLAEIGIQLLGPKQERKPSQQSVEAGTTLKETQLCEPAPSPRGKSLLQLEHEGSHKEHPQTSFPADSQMVNEHPKFGLVSVRGRRRDMEDAVAVHPSFLRRHDQITSGSHYFGVYDGHGCSHVAMKCRDRMHELVREELENKDTCTESGWKNAMEGSFSRMDKEVNAGNLGASGAICRCELQECNTVGSTAVVAIVMPEKIVVANCGDSRAVLCRNGEAIPLSSDHKPDRPDELQRIESAGGRVIFWDGPRVFGVLPMSRAIGDEYLKPYVSCEPEVTITERSAGDECLILASDGLWDVVSNETACNVARMCLKGKAPEGVEGAENDGGGEGWDKACSDASKLLTKLALARDSTDNVSVVVVDLSKDR